MNNDSESTLGGPFSPNPGWPLFAVPRSQIEENGDRIVGPFTVGQLLEAAQTLRHGNLGGPHCPAKAGALRSPQ